MLQSKSFRGQRVLITGAAGGIGAALATQLAQRGARLFLTDLRGEALQDVAASLGGAEVHAQACDAGDGEAIAGLAAKVTEIWGGLDILINNAGIGHNGAIQDTPITQWEALFRVNLLGPIRHVEAFLPMMQAAGRGHIVNISSGQAFFRLPSWGAYACSKVALAAYSELLGLELERQSIHVTTVYPFLADTGFYGGIDAETSLGRWSVKLMPYYAMSPARVARRTLQAMRVKRKVAWISPFNLFGYYMRLFPPLADAVGRVGTALLVRPRATAGAP